MGELKADETINLPVAPGEHRLQLKIDWASSNKLLFNARAGEDIYLECGNNVGDLAGGWKPLATKLLTSLTVVRSSYLYVKRV